MNNRKRLISLIGYATTDDTYDGALIDNGINGVEEYSAAGYIPMQKAKLQILKKLLSTADTRNENGYAITYDRNSLLKDIEDTEGEIGKTAGLATIRNKSYLW